MQIGNETAEVNNFMVNLFAKKFSSDVYANLYLSSANINFEYSESFSNILSTGRDVKSVIIYKLDKLSQPGADHIYLISSLQILIIYSYF